MFSFLKPNTPRSPASPRSSSIEAIPRSKLPVFGSSTMHGGNFVKVTSATCISEMYRISGDRIDGSGAGTAILMATKKQDGSKVVIKTLDKTKVNAAVEKEWTEANKFLRTIPKIEGLCQHFEVFETPKAYYSIMERCMGKDLFEHIAAGHLRKETVQEIMRQFVDALRRMHECGLIHKDLKLRNVVADVQPSHVIVKIIDLDTMTKYDPKFISKSVLGSDGYIAPEGYDGKYSPASDVYSAGAILYRLITRAFPHKKDLFDDKPGENYPGHPSMKRIKKRLETARIDWNLSPLDTWPEAVSLLQAMLSVSTDHRISANAAVHHRFFDSLSFATPVKPKGSGYGSTSKVPNKAPPIDIAAASTCDSLPDMDGMDSDSDSDSDS